MVNVRLPGKEDHFRVQALGSSVYGLGFRVTRDCDPSGEGGGFDRGQQTLKPETLRSEPRAQVETLNPEAGPKLSALSLRVTLPHCFQH